MTINRNSRSQYKVLVRLSTVLVTILIGVLLAGCSKAKPAVLATTTTQATSPPEIWVAQTCAALETNFNTINSATNAYKSSFNSKEQLITAQQNLVGFLNQVESAYQVLLNQINSLNPPKVTDGLKSDNTIKIALRDAYDSVNAAITLAQNLPTDNVSSFHASASQLSVLLNEALTKTNSIINGVQNSKYSPTLNSLFAKNKNCPP